jgi:hypothetical protein
MTQYQPLGGDFSTIAIRGLVRTGELYFNSIIWTRHRGLIRYLRADHTRRRHPMI